MAVLERTYKRYEGALSPEWSRFLIIPRHAFRHVFRSKLFTGFYVLSFVTAAGFCDPDLSASQRRSPGDHESATSLNVLPIDAAFFQTFVMVQGWIGFYSGAADRPATGVARFDQQCVAALSAAVPSAAPSMWSAKCRS